MKKIFLFSKLNILKYFKFFKKYGFITNNSKNISFIKNNIKIMVINKFHILITTNKSY